MKYGYTPVEKNQKNNPFCKMRNSDQTMLQQGLLERLVFLAQLGASKDPHDQNVYDLLCNKTSKADWGSAPIYNNAPNTALAILAGAVEKLQRGDLSLKQVERINTVCECLHIAYPRKFSELELVEETEVAVNVPLSNLFEGIA